MEAPDASAPQPLPPQNTAHPADFDAADIEKNKDLAAFSYLWIMSVVVFFLRRNSPFVRFHAKQAMVLFLLSILFLFIPIVSKILELGVLALMVLGFVNAAQGKKKDIPIIGPLSRREIGIRDAWRQVVDFVARIVKSFRSQTPPPPPSSSPSMPPEAPAGAKEGPPSSPS